ncbi:hypothetical protein NXS19_004640 [Fusarium pseudograminearum]|nr:hypothetical protein NXS19_004640 [Fusarium pseudograminearum]
MNEYGMRDSEGHERSALQFSQQSAITSDGLRSTECPILNLDAFLSPNLEPSREFECRRRSAVYYLEQYLGSLDRISHTCADFDTGATEALSNQSHSRTQRDMVRLKICTDTALRDLNVMESILLCTQENQKVQPQSLSPTAAFCTCTLCISAIVIPLKAAAVASGLGAFVGAMALTLPPIWQSLQCYNEHLEHLSNVADQEADQEASQSAEDCIYKHLPDILAAAKTARVPANEFVPFCCRFCGIVLKSLDDLGMHLGKFKNDGKISLVCKTAQTLLREAGVVWDPSSLVDDAETDMEVV